MIEHSDRIVIFGQSCVGKTTFARQINRPYVGFDKLFPWHMIETLGLSFDAAMQQVKDKCESMPKFVLDGWHLGDQEGRYIPKDTTVYVLISPYEKIIEQYRVPVNFFEQHRHMFRQWYSIKYPSPTRYFTVSDGSFVEITNFDFVTLREQSL